MSEFFIVQRASGRTHQVLVDEDDLERVVQRGRWTYHPKGYAYYSRPGVQKIYLHRFILNLSPDDPIVDHRNGNKLDNRKENLRLSDNSLNLANQALINNRDTSKYRGVCWDQDRNRWRAEQRFRGQRYHLGRFLTEEEAFAALMEFREEHDLVPGY